MVRSARGRLLTCALLWVCCCAAPLSAAQWTLLFVGDRGHHTPAERYAQLAPVLARQDIQLDYVEGAAVLTADRLRAYDGVVIYANIEHIDRANEQALVDYVESGHGLIGIHCASYCFLNSDRYVALLGGQFLKHGTGIVHTQCAAPQHPLIKGFGGFFSWDETYTHHRHQLDGRTVLETRQEGTHREPWTWIRRQERGRVFYTAWGHDQRTWSQPGFQNLVERGIRWAVGGDPQQAGRFVGPETLRASAAPVSRAHPDAVLPFQYVEEPQVPFYPPGGPRQNDRQQAWQMQLPLAPAESLKHVVTPRMFHVELFAAEPDIIKPICMAWDHRGRLWCGETQDYPNQLQADNRGHDQIKICEDTDSDGRADKFTVFATGLSIPTAIAFHRGGVIVQNGTETLYLKDTDGDDRADVRQVMIRGWTMGDTHGGVSNFQYGLDNWFWAMQGYNRSQPVIKGHKYPATFRMGFFRFRPDPPALEFLRGTNNNTWGLGITEEGLVFGSTANRNPSVYLPIPNRYYERVRGWSVSELATIADTHLFHPITDKIRQVDHHGGYTAGAGHAIYTARRYPQVYWNRTAFVCGPTGKLVGTFWLQASGADFQSTNPINLVASDDEWTAPIMAEVGPDGNVWVLDWYNYIVQHNPTPAGFQTGRGNAYETRLRDKRHGRIYRVVYGGESKTDPGDRLTLAGASPQKLVQTLRNPTMLWRKHAQRLLVERGQQDVVPQLIALVRDRTVDEVGLNVGAIHALWTLAGLHALEGDRADPAAVMAVVAALEHPSAGVRRNAVMVLPRDGVTFDRLRRASLFGDSDAQVRLATLLAVSECPRSRAAGQLLARLATAPSLATDRWLRDAWTMAAAAHDAELLAALLQQPPPEVAPELLDRIAVVAGHGARSGLDGPVPSLLPVAAAATGKRWLPAIIKGWASGWPAEQQLPLSDSGQAALVKLFHATSGASRGMLIRLARQWGSDVLRPFEAEVVTELLKIVDQSSLPTAQRLEAADKLVLFQPESAVAVGELLERVTPRSDPLIARGLLAAAGRSRANATGPRIVQLLQECSPIIRSTAIQILLSRPGWTRALLDGIQSRQLQLADLSLDQKRTLMAHPDDRIAARAQRLVADSEGIPNPDRQQVLEQMLPLAGRNGDVAAGHEVYRRECSKCHVLGAEGTRIGPDLTGMSVHSKEELLTRMIDPSRNVEGNFRVYTVITEDGRIQTGLLAAETATSIELYDTEGKRHVLQREDIDELTVSPKSLMPDGFEKQMKPVEVSNLLAFLTNRGKYSMLNLRKVATIVSTRGMFYDENSTTERLVFPDWKVQHFAGVPFHLVDPRGDRVPNVIMLYSRNGKFPPRMPRKVSLPINQPARAIHMLGGVGGWAAKKPRPDGPVCLIVRLHYRDGAVEDHPLRDGQQFADYIGRFDVPGSQFAFALRNQQMRYLKIQPRRRIAIETMELVKGQGPVAPIVMSVTVEAVR